MHLPSPLSLFHCVLLRNLHWFALGALVWGAPPAPYNTPPQDACTLVQDLSGKKQQEGRYRGAGIYSVAGTASLAGCWCTKVSQPPAAQKQ